MGTPTPAGGGERHDWTLYRSACATDPWFGRHSFWTFSRQDAERLSMWKAGSMPDSGPTAIYEAAVAIAASEVLDLTRLGAIDSGIVIECADEWRVSGKRWATFYESLTEGQPWMVAVLLDGEVKAFPA